MVKVAVVGVGYAWLAGARFPACDTPVLSQEVTRGVDRPENEPDANCEKMTRRVDELLEASWAAAGVEPAFTATDEQFIRRAYLDFTGIVPRISDVRHFAVDNGPGKRERLIAALLASPRYATHMAATWRNRILPDGVDPSREQEAFGLQKWLRLQFAKNLRYDNLVGGLLLTAGGDELGPALYYRANDLAPEKLAATTAELFMGIDLACAQCHDHPYADWSQRDFWGMAAFFARVQAPPAGTMAVGMPYRLVDVEQGEVRLPDSAEVVLPRYPSGDEWSDDSRRSRRVQLAIWMTSRRNDFFAKATVNWAWEHLFGKALVESVDQFDPDSAETNHKLLHELSQHFVASKFDLKSLWLTLGSTRAYQLSSSHDAGDSVPPELFARMLTKPLTPEQIYDSILIIVPRRKVDSGAEGAGIPIMPDEDPLRSEFIRRMRAPKGDRTEYLAGTLQALLMMNGATMAGATTRGGNPLLGALDAPFLSDEDCVEVLFLAALSRQPTREEEEACVKLLSTCESDSDRAQARGDVLWALLNSTEFAFVH